MIERREVEFKIQCYDPEVDDKPYYKYYDIELEKGVTVLRAINHVKDHIDPSLTFRFFCQAGICGSCSVKVNGVAKLACTTQLWDVLPAGANKAEVLIEPLGNLKIIRDLVVDVDPVVEKLTKYKTWTESKMTDSELGKKEFRVTPAEFEPINAATDCILCASCYSECSISEVTGGYISPLVMLRAYRQNKDTRDVATKKRLDILNQDGGIWDCTHCYKCVEACVKDIPIMDAIQGLRQQSIEAGYKTEGSRHALAFQQDIISHGRLKEVTLPLRTLGLGKTLAMIPFALKMGAKGRVPPIIPHKIKEQQEVKDLMNAVEAQEAR